jgi:Icc-related predicted phosphoesterase
MLAFLVIGDVHDEQERLSETLDLVKGERFDLALLTGDIGRDPPWLEPARSCARQDHDRSIRRTIDRIRSFVAAPVVFVPGNHDMPDPPEPSGGINADGAIVEVAGLRVAGLGGSGPHRYGFPYEWSEEEAGVRLETTLAGGEAHPDVLLSHAPPAESRLDPTADGRHVGSRAVDHWIERARPRLFVCGHIHEAWGVEFRHGVCCINAGALGEPYGQAMAFTVTWAGRPIRVRCLRRGPRNEILREEWTAPRLTPSDR